MTNVLSARVAVIGLGSMGYGIAASLRRAGFDVAGCDVSAAAVRRFESEGGRGAATPAEAAADADVVFSVVVNAAQRGRHLCDAHIGPAACREGV